MSNEVSIDRILQSLTGSDAGIDYGLGKSNRDVNNPEYHYGIISGNAISSWALNETLEPDYGDPHCPKCGNDAKEEEQDKLDKLEPYTEYDCYDYICETCGIYFESCNAYPEECLGASYEDEELSVHLDSSNEVWIFKSPYYTLCAYCSPCAPGAGYLTNQREHGIKAYCLPLDWFDADDNAPCPYKIYRVSDDSLIFDPTNIDNQEEN